MLKFKEGQTYICTKSNKPWWTEGEEYCVQLRNGELYLIDDDGDGFNENYINSDTNKFIITDSPVMENLPAEERPIEKEQENIY